MIAKSMKKLKQYPSSAIHNTFYSKVINLVIFTSSPESFRAMNNYPHMCGLNYSGSIPYGSVCTAIGPLLDARNLIAAERVTNGGIITFYE